MKKFRFCIFMIVLLAIASCKKDSDEPEVTNEPEVTITVPEVVVPDVAGESKTTFKTSEPWSLELTDTKAVPTWFEVSPKNGGAGEVTLTITIKSTNEDYDDRSAYIKIKVGAVIKIITLTQKKKDAILLTKDRYEIAPEGGTFDVEVKSNVQYEVIIPDYCKDWITKTPKSRGLTTTSESFSVAKGSIDGSRTGTVIFKSGTLIDTISVYQTQQNSMVLTSKTKNIDNASQNFDVELRTNVDYEVTILGGSWLRQVASKSIRVDRLTFVADENTGHDNRSIQVVVKGKNTTLSDTLVVSQSQKNALILSQRQMSVETEAVTVDVELKANIDYQIIMPSDKWISTISTKALTTYNHKFAVEALPSGEISRTTHIIFKDKNSTLSDTLVITQASKADTTFISLGNGLFLHKENKVLYCSSKTLTQDQLMKAIYQKFEDSFDMVFIINDETDAAVYSAGEIRLVSNNIKGLGLKVFNKGKDELGTVKLNSIINFYGELSFANSTIYREVCRNWAAYLSILPKNIQYDKKQLYPAVSEHWNTTNVLGVLGGFSNDMISLVRDTTQKKDSLNKSNRYYVPQLGKYDIALWLLSRPLLLSWGKVTFAPLELYLMGFLSKEQVPPLDVYENAYLESYPDMPFVEYMTAEKKTYTIDDIIAIEGERVPSYQNSQKEFRVLTVRYSNTQPELIDWANINSALTKISNKTEGNKSFNSFWEATGKQGYIISDNLKSQLKKTK